MASAFLQSHARTFTKPCSPCKLSPDAGAEKVVRCPFVLHPRLWLRPSCRLSAASYFPPFSLSAPRRSKWGGFDLQTCEEIISQRNKRKGFAVKAQGNDADEDEDVKRGPKGGELYRNLSPELKELTKERPDINPYLIIAGLTILLLIWKAIANELLYWLGLVTYALRPVIALAFVCVETAAEAALSVVDAAAPVAAAVMTGTAWAFLVLKEVYRFIIDMTPVQALIEAIVLASAVLGIGEATMPNVISSQPYTIGMAGLFGLGAVLGLFPSSVFVALLLFLVAFSSLVMKRDLVSSIMPVAAVLAAVAEPWVRGVALASFLALAIYQNWKSPEKEQVALDNDGRYKGQPIIMYVLSLMIGISAAAQWMYFRHLLWFAK